jgi:hypothetical protein
MMNLGKTRMNDHFTTFVGAASGRPLGFLFPGVKSERERVLALKEIFPQAQ